MTDKQDPIAHAARLLREAAEELRQAHAYNNSEGWENETDAKAAYDEHLAAAQALEDWEAAVGAGGVSGPLMGIAAPPTAQAEGWVSVEERLPPVRTTVFIASGAGTSAWRTLAFYDPDRYTPAWRCNDDPSEGIRGVSHWMHMPIPPTSAEGVEHG